MQYIVVSVVFKMRYLTLSTPVLKVSCYLYAWTGYGIPVYKIASL